MNVVLGMLVLSSFVAQAGPATPAPVVSATPNPAATSTTSGTSMPGAMPATAPSLATPPPDDPGVRRGPATAPRMLPPNAAGDATIRNSGSTNTAGYTVVIHPGDSADVTVDGEVSHRTVGAAQVRWLFAKLRAAGPLDGMAGGRCMKSASFGSTTTIAYNGHVSPDLSCSGDAMSRELARTAEVIVAKLGIAGTRMRRALVR